jgi:hypothetical protein
MSHMQTRIAIGAGAAIVLSVVGVAGIAVAAGTAPPVADVSDTEQQRDESTPLPVFTPPALNTPTQEPPGSFDTASVGPFEPAPWR